MMKEIIVNEKYNEKKLNKIVLEEISEINYPTFCKLLRKKDIKINGKRVNKDTVVYENDKIEIYLPKELENRVREIALDKVYEDDNILIINKPVNIEVTGINSLTEIINKQYTNSGFKPKPCHRIDRNTRGLIIFAKNKDALEIMLEKFKKHEIEKHYLALVYGIPKKEQRLEAYLFKDNKKAQVYISDIFKKGYQKIITSYKVIEKKKNTALLDVEIETGKTHQIRAHLAHIGYPIIGDGKYGKNDVNKQFGKKYQMLCSYRIKFNFKTESGILSYLNGKEIKLKNVKM